MNTQNNNPFNEQFTAQPEQREQMPAQPVEKKQFVEPLVSVPVDVLEATTFFQAPTIDTSTV